MQEAAPSKKDTRRKFMDEHDECCLLWILSDQDRLDKIWPGKSIPRTGQEAAKKETIDALIDELKTKFPDHFGHMTQELLRNKIKDRLKHLKDKKSKWAASRSDEDWKRDKLSTVNPSLRTLAQELENREVKIKAEEKAREMEREEKRRRNRDFAPALKPLKEETTTSNSTRHGPATKKRKGSKDDPKAGPENEKSDEQKRSDSLVVRLDSQQDNNSKFDLREMDDEFYVLKYHKYMAIILDFYDTNPYDDNEATMLTEESFNRIEAKLLEHVAILLRARYADILQFFDAQEQNHLVEFKSFYSGVIKAHYNLEKYNELFKDLPDEEKPTFSHVGRIYGHPGFYINKGEVAQVFSERLSVTKGILTRMLEPLYDEVCDLFTQAAEANLEQIDMVYLNALMFLEYVGETARGKQNRRAINDAIRLKKEILTTQVCEWKETKEKQLHGENASFDGPNYVQKICGLQANIARVVFNYHAYVKAARFMGLIALAAIPNQVREVCTHVVNFFTFAKESFESLREKLFQSFGYHL
ncbi:hypothetical protein DdX_12826 [Ditylenchus destructor]|uniref:Uncharacterized protein n=1 Tax=Ditylenchus destructor TaxID=166010 RepID=A0AAD4MX67_9BILA|nr:hypothetical protein DdX_12826 [Ditylenchus destructor]